jgi:hypothetical protein
VRRGKKEQKKKKREAAFLLGTFLMGDSLICDRMDPKVSERILNGLMCGREA